MNESNKYIVEQKKPCIRCMLYDDIYIKYKKPGRVNTLLEVRILVVPGRGM